MRTRRKATIEELRRAIDCLPRHTRVAMLDGIRANPIIVGAYSTDDGICPMLAAHRAGGRTNCISFARAWDRFALGDVRRALARRASRRELLVLTSHLESSLLAEEALPPLGQAISEHQTLVGADRNRDERPGDRERGDERPGDRNRAGERPGDRDRAPELAARPGWAWLRVMRRYDEYELAMARLDSSEAAAAR